LAAYFGQEPPTQTGRGQLIDTFVLYVPFGLALFEMDNIIII